MRGSNLADKAVAVVRVRDAPGPPASTLVYLTTACTPCHLHYLRACWPNALRRGSVLAEADVLTYAGCRGATSPSAWAHALAALPVRNATLAFTRWNPGYQEGAMAAVMVPRTCADISKARKMLGYDPKTPLADGIRKLVAWYHEAHPVRPSLVRVVTPEDPLHDLRDLKPAVLRCGLVSTSDRPVWTRPARDAQAP